MGSCSHHECRLPQPSTSHPTPVAVHSRIICPDPRQRKQRLLFLTRAVRTGTVMPLKAAHAGNAWVVWQIGQSRPLVLVGASRPGAADRGWVFWVFLRAVPLPR